MGFLNTIQNILKKLSGFFRLLMEKRRQLNQAMVRRNDPSMLALVCVGVCALVAAIALFLNPCLGIANDSIGNAKMQEYGLSYLETDRGPDPSAFLSNEYFTRQYEVSYAGDPIHSSQNPIVRLAMILYGVIFRGGRFDIRMLAFLYLLLYLPAVFLVLRSAMERVTYFSERVIIAVLGTAIFSDISYLTSFNSLYTDPLILICLLYVAGASMSMHKEHPAERILLPVFAAAAAFLCLLEHRFFIAGIICAVLLGSQIRILSTTPRKAACGLLAIGLIFCSVFGMYWTEDEFDDISKVHSVTRGILLESQTPDRSLNELGIDSSYSLLTDQSLYAYYPPSEISNPVLQEGFLDRYTTGDILLYYCRHPAALFSLWNNAIHSALHLRRDYCSNYERSVGMAPMSKSIFWSVWSTFKDRSLPSTIGYLLLLIAAYSLMTGRKVFNQKIPQRWDYMYFVTMTAITVIGIADITAVICLSGDAQFIQCSTTLGIVMDLLLYYVAAEVLHKLNILEGQNDE